MDANEFLIIVSLLGAIAPFVALIGVFMVIFSASPKAKYEEPPIASQLLKVGGFFAYCIVLSFLYYPGWRLAFFGVASTN
ncbi:MAG: hypothetical protein HC852_01645 [Acaryochloridaceae cyanobacterium RU_4_10]|nr:hypothetical protein [Acaryochloridaceae cyanobacterium RU_4_10]